MMKMKISLLDNKINTEYANEENYIETTGSFKTL